MVKSFKRFIPNIFCICLIIHGCNTDGAKKKIHLSIGDAPEREIKDSLNFQTSEELNAILSEFKMLYKNPIHYDSTFSHRGSVMNLSLLHSCLCTNGMSIPQKYIGSYKIDSFFVYQFQSKIKLKKDGVEILDTLISKKDFNIFLDTSLQTYGTLLYPEPRVSDSLIGIGYSISIPLTDIGIGVSIIIGDDGKIVTKNR